MRERRPLWRDCFSDGREEREKSSPPIKTEAIWITDNFTTRYHTEREVTRLRLRRNSKTNNRKINNTFLLRRLWLRLFLFLLLLRTLLRISIRLPLLALLIIIDLDLLSCTLLRTLQSSGALLVRCNILILVIVIHPCISVLVLILVFLVALRRQLLLSFPRFLLLFLLLQLLVLRLDTSFDVCSDRGLQDALLADLALLQLGGILERSPSRERLSRRVIKLIDNGARTRWDRVR